MDLTAITHASARDKKHNFRGLTASGEEESVSAAERYRELTSGRSASAFDRIVSSPKPRCLETVLLFAKAHPNEMIRASSVAVDSGLAAGEIEGDELSELAATGDAEHLLVSGHADLVETLPAATELVDEAADGGWFSVRPVLFQVQVRPGREWDDATVRFCTAPVDGEWESLLA